MKTQTEVKPAPTPTPLSISELRLRIDDTEFCTRVLCFLAVIAHEALVKALTAFVDQWDIPLTKSQREARIENAKQALAQAGEKP